MTKVFCCGGNDDLVAEELLFEKACCKVTHEVWPYASGIAISWCLSGYIRNKK